MLDFLYVMFKNGIQIQKQKKIIDLTLCCSRILTSRMTLVSHQARCRSSSGGGPADAPGLPGKIIKWVTGMSTAPVRPTNLLFKEALVTYFCYKWIC